MPSPTETPKGLLKRVRQARQDMTRRILELLVGAFTLVTALAWNDAVKSMFAVGGVLAVATRWGPWVHAVFITLCVYVATSFAKQYVTPPCTTLCAATLAELAAPAADRWPTHACYAPPIPSGVVPANPHV